MKAEEKRKEPFGPLLESLGCPRAPTPTRTGDHRLRRCRVASDVDDVPRRDALKLDADAHSNSRNDTDRVFWTPEPEEFRKRSIVDGQLVLAAITAVRLRRALGRGGV